MKYLLDTHSFLWFLEGNESLSKKARSAIEDSKNENFSTKESAYAMELAQQSHNRRA